MIVYIRVMTQEKKRFFEYKNTQIRECIHTYIHTNRDAYSSKKMRTWLIYVWGHGSFMHIKHCCKGKAGKTIQGSRSMCQMPQESDQKLSHLRVTYEWLKNSAETIQYKDLGLCAKCHKSQTRNTQKQCSSCLETYIKHCCIRCGSRYVNI